MEPCQPGVVAGASFGVLDGDLLYGVTHRGEDIQNIRFMISVARLAPGWRSAAIVAELTDPLRPKSGAITCCDGRGH